MTDQYPLAGSPYQLKSADEVAQTMNTSDDPVRTVLDELTALLHDRGTQRWLYEQDSVPVPAMQPWLQELYGRGVADGRAQALQAQSPDGVVTTEETP